MAEFRSLGLRPSTTTLIQIVREDKRTAVLVDMSFLRSGGAGSASGCALTRWPGQSRRIMVSRIVGV